MKLVVATIVTSYSLWSAMGVFGLVFASPVVGFAIAYLLTHEKGEI